MRKRHICLIGVSLILLLWVVFAVVRDVSISRKEDGRYLTGAFMGPFVYQGEVYVRSDLNSFPESEDTGVLGCVKESWWDSLSLTKWNKRMWEIQSDIIADRRDPERTYLKIQSEQQFYYTKASALESSGDIDRVIEEYDDFIIQECRSRIVPWEVLESHGLEWTVELQRFRLPKASVEALRELYGPVPIREEDFKRHGEVYLLMAGDISMKDFSVKYFNGYYKIPEMEDGLRVRFQPHFFISVLFLEDGKLYYGNYDNEITGEMYDTILRGIEGIKAEF